MSKTASSLTRRARAEFRPDVRTATEGDSVQFTSCDMTEGLWSKGPRESRGPSTPLRSTQSGGMQQTPPGRFSPAALEPAWDGAADCTSAECSAGCLAEIFLSTRNTVAACLACRAPAGAATLECEGTRESPGILRECSQLARFRGKATKAVWQATPSRAARTSRGARRRTRSRSETYGAPKGMGHESSRSRHALSRLKCPHSRRNSRTPERPHPAPASVDCRAHPPHS